MTLVSLIKVVKFCIKFIERVNIRDVFFLIKLEMTLKFSSNMSDSSR